MDLQGLTGDVEVERLGIRPVALIHDNAALGVHDGLLAGIARIAILEVGASCVYGNHLFSFV